MAQDIDPEMKVFWDTELANIIQRLDGNVHRLPGIQERFNLLISRANNRYMRPIDLRIVCAELKIEAGEGRRIAFGCSVTNGQPSVTIVVPEMKRTFDELRQEDPGLFRRMFENFVIVSFLHELDHLALGIVGGADISVAQIIECERMVWAETCETTLRLFTETYKEILYVGDRLYYAAWIRGGRNAESQTWRDFIAKMYGQIQPSQTPR